jgi:ADP-ribosyl-[dinitrogen reductase] hydrolase
MAAASTLASRPSKPYGGRFLETGDPIAGSIDPNTAGNGSIMRLAPVALRWAYDPPKAIAVAHAQSVTTHAAPAAVAGCALLAEILVEAIVTGGPATNRSSYDRAPPLNRRLRRSPAAGSWWGKDRSAISSSGYVVHTLEAAL